MIQLFDQVGVQFVLCTTLLGKWSARIVTLLYLFVRQITRRDSVWIIFLSGQLLCPILSFLCNDPMSSLSLSVLHRWINRGESGIKYLLSDSTKINWWRHQWIDHSSHNGTCFSVSLQFECRSRQCAWVARSAAVCDGNGDGARR